MTLSCTFTSLSEQNNREKNEAEMQREMTLVIHLASTDHEGKAYPNRSNVQNPYVINSFMLTNATHKLAKEVLKIEVLMLGLQLIHVTRERKPQHVIRVFK